MENRTAIIITGQILLAITIFACTLVVTGAIKDIKFGQGTLYVKGCAEKEIKSDFATWHGSISATDDTKIGAYDKLEGNLNTLRRYLENAGVPLDQVELSPIYVSENYKINDKGKTTNIIESYTLRQEFSMATANISLIAKVSQDITSLIKEGLSIYSGSPQYLYLKIDELKIAMLGEAAKDAYQRATELVSKSHARVGTLRSAQQGVFQITPAYSTSVSDYGEYDTSSIAKRIKAVVTMEYAID